MGDDGDLRSESAPAVTDAQVEKRDQISDAPAVPILGPRLEELVVVFLAIVGAVALGLGISDYLGEHRYVLGYLCAYAGFRIANAILSADAGAGQNRDAARQALIRELPILLLFAAAPFERTYIYGGSPSDGIAVFGLVMELAGLWLVIGARVQRRFSAGRDGHGFLRSGFYRYVRHPIRAGSCLVLFGWPFEYGAPVVAVVTLAILLIVSSRAIRDEESAMQARFGEEYEAYVRDTDRMIPSVW